MSKENRPQLRAPLLIDARPIRDGEELRIELQPFRAQSYISARRWYRDLRAASIVLEKGCLSTQHTSRCCGAHSCRPSAKRCCAVSFPKSRTSCSANRYRPNSSDSTRRETRLRGSLVRLLARPSALHSVRPGRGALGFAVHAAAGAAEHGHPGARTGNAREKPFHLHIDI
jgi:hypothetical protein